MSVLALDMAYSLDVLVSYDQIGASIPLCICHTDTLLKVVRSILI